MKNKLVDKYLFRSERLGFRNWNSNDLSVFSKINADPEVMEHFPKLLTHRETEAFIERLQEHFQKHGYTYYATDVLETGELIGFIGLAYQDYKTSFNPATDIGWRLKKSVWGNGYATEGAKRCLKFAFEELGLSRIIATCTLDNFKSEHVMKKIGMYKQGVFKHPKLSDYAEFEKCIWYEINR